MLADARAPHPTLVRALRGDADAIRFVQALIRVCDVWDDLIDGDAPVGAEDVHQAFWLALCDIPTNPFYQLHQQWLMPVMQMGVMSWMAANDLQARPGRRERSIAYVARSEIAEVLTVAARLIGGPDWAREVAADIKLFVHSEEPDEFFAEMEKAHGMGIRSET